MADAGLGTKHETSSPFGGLVLSKHCKHRCKNACDAILRFPSQSEGFRQGTVAVNVQSATLQRRTPGLKPLMI